jgi:uncharacterized membrane protein YdbT with pleckstrin-like domain
MSVADNLIANETIVFGSKKHWVAPIRASLTAALLIVGAWLIRIVVPDSSGFLGPLWGLVDLIAIGLFIAGIGWIVYNIVAWRTAEFAVTNMRILREEGLVSRRSSTTLLSSLSDVRTNVGFIGRRLDYGDIVLLTQSGSAGEDRFLAITKPEAFRRAVMDQKMQSMPGPAAPAAPAAPATPQTAAPVAPAAPRPPATSSIDDAETLKRLADLRDSGAITSEEYQAKKSEILARM